MVTWQHVRERRRVHSRRMETLTSSPLEVKNGPFSENFSPLLTPGGPFSIVHSPRRPQRGVTPFSMEKQSYWLLFFLILHSPRTHPPTSEKVWQPLLQLGGKLILHTPRTVSALNHSRTKKAVPTFGGFYELGWGSGEGGNKSAHTVHCTHHRNRVFHGFQ